MTQRYKERDLSIKINLKKLYENYLTHQKEQYKKTGIPENEKREKGTENLFRNIAG